LVTLISVTLGLNISQLKLVN